MRLSMLLEGLEAKILGGKGCENTEIAALSFDSRQVVVDSLFFCLKGGSADGHAFASDALKNGAAALVVEEALDIDLPQVLVSDTRTALSVISGNFYGNASHRLKVIGITGTNGKTTTAHMLAATLKSAGKSVGIIGTLGVKYADENLPSDMTTPDPVFLQKTLADMRIKGVEYVVMEVSAHALYYRKIVGMRFAACIFTNLTQDHLDFFKDMGAYKAAKSSLFTNEICPIAIVNGDDEVGREFGKTRSNTLYYGLNTPSDAFAIITHEDLGGIECIFNINDELVRASLAFTGRHNVYNALAALTCATALGEDIEQAAQGFKELKGVSGRLENAGRIHGAEIFVDFAHTPDGLEKSLTALKTHAKGRLICLFGCGGNRDKTKRPLMGMAVAKKCDFAILTSDNPRFEDPLDILADIEKGYRRFSTKYVVVPDRAKAIEYAIDLLREGDILLVAGKGGEYYQEVMGIKYPFYDNDIIEKIIRKKELLS